MEQVERWSGGAGGTVGRWRPEFTRSSQGVHKEFTVPGRGTGAGFFLRKRTDYKSVRFVL